MQQVLKLFKTNPTHEHSISQLACRATPGTLHKHLHQFPGRSALEGLGNIWIDLVRRELRLRRRGAELAARAQTFHR